MWTRRDEERMWTRRRRKEGRDTRRKERGPVILHTMGNNVMPGAGGPVLEDFNASQRCILVLLVHVQNI